jgi:hypothetical protein
MHITTYLICKYLIFIITIIKIFRVMESQDIVKNRILYNNRIEKKNK